MTQHTNLNDGTAASRTPRPVFFGNAGTDALWDIVSALTIELGATRARLDALERIMDEQKLIQKGTLDQWVPNSDDAKERTYAHQDYIRRIYNTLSQQ
jgi:hypothetical protein